MCDGEEDDSGHIDRDDGKGKLNFRHFTSGDHQHSDSHTEDSHDGQRERGQVPIKKGVVGFADAAVQPLAVVVEVTHAPVARLAVLARLVDVLAAEAAERRVRGMGGRRGARVAQRDDCREAAVHEQQQSNEQVDADGKVLGRARVHSVRLSRPRDRRCVEDDQDDLGRPRSDLPHVEGRVPRVAPRRVRGPTKVAVIVMLLRAQRTEDAPSVIVAATGVVGVVVRVGVGVGVVRRARLLGLLGIR